MKTLYSLFFFLTFFSCTYSHPINDGKNYTYPLKVQIMNTARGFNVEMLKKSLDCEKILETTSLRKVEVEIPNKKYELYESLHRGRHNQVDTGTEKRFMKLSVLEFDNRYIKYNLEIFREHKLRTARLANMGTVTNLYSMESLANQICLFANK